MKEAIMDPQFVTELDIDWASELASADEAAEEEARAYADWAEYCEERYRSTSRYGWDY